MGGILTLPSFLTQFPEINPVGLDSSHKSTIQGDVLAARSSKHKLISQVFPSHLTTLDVSVARSLQSGWGMSLVAAKRFFSDPLSWLLVLHCNALRLL